MTVRPEPDAIQFARAKLATAKIDKAIRESLGACGGPLHPAQALGEATQLVAH